ncbi:amino acid/amide ABC transporter ATP-binding protein 2 (HAAT family) [Litoreibacter ponti]|uniref:Amino acid/amide ABC transporter ATP-binding protein 2 (HAAT family) n=1 Tax=Litoreibacter ponti TaxID=1510457 RepID=A0A2T6BHJ0_9RHOB|nr:ABC transporter ATP-binding protein [Litoreibacter ponti]PTX55524.1 amino acid/amide ABC transporter ATP-binding protein 2 (HAAT family) [Litoreibacter ponti]
MSFLEVGQLTASYGSSQALFGVDVAMQEGEVTALLGRNGMGKSSTVKAICRMIPAQGTLALDGTDLHALPSHRVARMGVGLVPEGRRCFKDLSVQENLIAACRPGAWTLASVTALFPRLGERLGQRASSLSGGEQQMLAIGRALMTNPRLLILDEATEGLAPIIRQEIWAAIRTLKSKTGVSILLIDKSLRELAQVSDKAVILERGKTVWAGPMGELTADISERFVGV